MRADWVLVSTLLIVGCATSSNGPAHSENPFVPETAAVTKPARPSTGTFAQTDKSDLGQTRVVQAETFAERFSAIAPLTK
jgi:hypothetical protein